MVDFYRKIAVYLLKEKNKVWSSIKLSRYMSIGRLYKNSNLRREQNTLMLYSMYVLLRYVRLGYYLGIDFFSGVWSTSFCRATASSPLTSSWIPLTPSSWQTSSGGQSTTRPSSNTGEKDGGGNFAALNFLRPSVIKWTCGPLYYKMDLRPSMLYTRNGFAALNIINIIL